MSYSFHIASASTGAKVTIRSNTLNKSLARKNELKAKSTLMLSQFLMTSTKVQYAIKGCKVLWEGDQEYYVWSNSNQRKMKKTILKQNYENFAASSQEGLDNEAKNFDNVDDLPTDSLMPDLEDTTDLLNTGIFSGAYDDEDEGAEADLNNLETTINQTRTNHKDYQNCLFAYFLSQKEPKKVIQALDDPSWIEAMQEELLQLEAIRLFLTLHLYAVYCVLDGLQVMQRDDVIFIIQDKYMADILKKFDFSSVKTASTLIETNKALLKDAEAKDVDVHLYRLMIGSLMYLTASRPDIIYLKGQPKLGLWYPRDSPFYLEAFFDSDYAGASLDRKSITGGC
ncbi:hypothetical protein Tco_0448908 [Tanacetum coccineum]